MNRRIICKWGNAAKIAILQEDKKKTLEAEIQTRTKKKKIRNKIWEIWT